MSVKNFKLGAESTITSATSHSGNSTYVQARIETVVLMDSAYMMDIIVETWDSIEENVRHGFARQVAALDWEDTMRLL